ncbi:hypothetical protein DIPPA_12660 [Diplonema papillatum]|nr:hypothetical protein DIPPA_12660 [Diplonema papillatum]
MVSLWARKTSDSGDKAEAVGDPDAMLQVAVDVLVDNVGIIVCSYTAPLVFQEFLRAEVDDDARQSIYQMMKGISGVLRTEESRSAFGNVLLGAVQPANLSGVDEMRKVRTGGLLHGDLELLKAFLRDYPEFADYIKLTRVNPFVVSALSKATARWLQLHPIPDDDEEEESFSCSNSSSSLQSTQASSLSSPSNGRRIAPVPELVFSKLNIQDGRVIVRGSSIQPMKKNMELRYSADEYVAVLGIYDKLMADLHSVLLLDDSKKSFMSRFANVEFEKQCNRLAEQAVLGLATIDPSIAPERLLRVVSSVSRKLMGHFVELCAGSSLWPATKARTLKDGLDRCIRACMLQQRLATAQAEGLMAPLTSHTTA